MSVKNTEKAPSMTRDFVRYAVPSVAGMVVSSLYTVIDGIFVGRGVGALALGAVNIVFPFIMLQIALSMLVAIGGANRFSMRRGQGDMDSANGLFCQSLTLLAMISLVVNVLVLAFAEPVCRMLGADDQLIDMAVRYMRWIALFGILYMPGLGLSIFVRNDGAPGLEMVGTLAGALSNIALDYWFIMVLDWGVEGAAIATGIGQMISVAIYALHLVNPRRTVRLRPTPLVWADMRRVLWNGVPSFLMEFSQSAIAFSFNLALMARMGARSVAAYSIVMYLCSIFNMVLVGIVQGAQPILSFEHGRGHAENERKIYRLGLRTNLCLTIIFYLATLIAGRAIAGLFSPEDPDLAAMAVKMMNIYFLGFIPVGCTLMNILYYQTTEREIPSIIISGLRCIGFVQLFLLILPGLLGEIGIYLAMPLGECMNLAVQAVLRPARRAAQAG